MYYVLVSAFGQIDDALKDVGDTQLEPTGLLRINSSRVAARMLVEPHICEFLTRYPKTKIELIMDDGLGLSGDHSGFFNQSLLLFSLFLY